MQEFHNSPDSLLARFISGVETGGLILITGSRGAGKTSWCLELVDSASKHGLQAVGLVSPAVFEGVSKIGYDLLDVRSGERKRLAVRKSENTKGEITKNWIVNNETIKWGNDVLSSSEACPLLIVDELGPLELERGVGLTKSLEMISARRYRLACVVVRPSLLELAQALFPWGQVVQIHSNRLQEAPV